MSGGERPVWPLADGTATERLGALIAQTCPWQADQPLSVHLQGELGAGKTTLVQGLLKSLGVTDVVRSPTYSLFESYTIAQGAVVHADLYRLREPAELEQIGLRDEYRPGVLLLIEWPERGGSVLPAADLIVQLEFDDARRLASVAPGTRLGTLWRAQLGREFALQV